MAKAWTWIQRALTSPETLALILGRYDWPEHWSPYKDPQPPSVEAVAGFVARVRVPDEVEMRRRLMRRHWWQLWALVDAREEELPALYEAVRRHPWGPYSRRERRRRRGHVLYTDPLQLTTDDVARLILEPQCTAATRIMVLRGWGTRLREALQHKGAHIFAR